LIKFFFYLCIFDQINAALLSTTDLTDPLSTILEKYNSIQQRQVLFTLFRVGMLLLPGKLVLNEESLTSEATLVVSERRSSEEPAILEFLLLGLRFSPKLP